MKVELLLSPGCPNASTAREVLAECVDRFGPAIQVREQVGDYPSPTILVNGIDVMTGRPGAPQIEACRLDVPTVAKVWSALRGASATSPRERAA